MACSNPLTIVRRGREPIRVSCGWCMNCRIAKRNKLSLLGRYQQYLYNLQGRGSAFCTLTYSDEFCPVNDFGDYTLRKSELQKFFKRLRRFLQRQKLFLNKQGCADFSYIACGEYGDRFGRPHYHFCIFGIDSDFMRTFCRKNWNLGLVNSKPLINGALRYVCKYIDKQVHGEQLILDYINVGKEPPFVVYSKGISRNYFNSHSDSNVINNSGNFVPIPRYWRNKLGLSSDMDKSDYVASIKKRATLAGKSFREYVTEQAYISELESVNSLRAHGVAVDDSSLISARLEYESARSKSSCIQPIVDRLLKK